MVNEVTLLGHLGQDLELRQTNSGKAVTTLRIAVNGSKNKEAEWFSITVWESQAENCVKYLKKGQKVFIRGYLRNKKWVDKDGNERKDIEINASNVQFL